jgi:hypothetical protein
MDGAHMRAITSNYNLSGEMRAHTPSGKMIVFIRLFNRIYLFLLAKQTLMRIKLRSGLEVIKVCVQIKKQGRRGEDMPAV